MVAHGRRRGGSLDIHGHIQPTARSAPHLAASCAFLRVLRRIRRRGPHCFGPGGRLEAVAFERRSFLQAAMFETIQGRLASLVAAAANGGVGEDASFEEESLKMSTVDQIGAEMSIVRPRAVDEVGQMKAALRSLEPGPSEQEKGGPQGADQPSAAKQPPTSAASLPDASFSSFDGASFNASWPLNTSSHIGDAPGPPKSNRSIAHIGDAPALSKSDGKRVAKPDNRNSSRDDFIEEMKASASAGPGRSGRKGSAVSVRRREGGMDITTQCAGGALVEPSTSSAVQDESDTNAPMRVAELQRAMAEAVSHKDYAASAALGRDLKAAKQAIALRRSELEQAVQAAVAQEDFEKVAELSAELESLEEAEPNAGGIGLAC